MITFTHVIGHLLDPDKILSFIKKNLNQDTIIILSITERNRLKGINCISSSKPEHILEWNFNEFLSYITDSNLDLIEHFYQHPLKLTLSNFVSYFSIWKNKTFGGDSQNFKYNQVLICKVEQ